MEKKLETESFKVADAISPDILQILKEIVSNEKPLSAKKPKNKNKKTKIVLKKK